MKHTLPRVAILAGALLLPVPSVGEAAGRYPLPFVRVATAGGDVLAAERDGRTLYTFSGGRDARCDIDCARDWQPFLVRANDFPTDGLGVVHRADSTRQWTLGNRPLYQFAGDRARGEAYGDGIGHWHALRPGDIGGESDVDAERPAGERAVEVRSGGYT